MATPYFYGTGRVEEGQDDLGNYAFVQVRHQVHEPPGDDRQWDVILRRGRSDDGSITGADYKYPDEARGILDAAWKHYEKVSKLTPKGIFALAVPLDDIEPNDRLPTMEEISYDEDHEPLEEFVTTWPYFAAHLLGAKSMAEVATVQDEGPGFAEGDIAAETVSDYWDQFVPSGESIPPEQSGYSMIEKGTLMGIECVRFYDTGYSAFVARTADVKDMMDPSIAERFERDTKGAIEGLKVLRERFDGEER